MVGVGLFIVGLVVANLDCPPRECKGSQVSDDFGGVAFMGFFIALASGLRSLTEAARMRSGPFSPKPKAFLDDLSRLLRSAGFNEMRDVDILPYHLDVVAWSSIFENSEYGQVARFIGISHVDSADIRLVQDFSSRFTEYALDNPATGQLEGLGCTVFAVPVLVSDDFDEETKKWAYTASPPKHPAAIESPVLISTRQRQAYFFGKTSV